MDGLPSNPKFYILNPIVDPTPTHLAAAAALRLGNAIFQRRTLQLGFLLHSSFKVNCYSLNSVGPTVKKICDRRRYLTIYVSSALASSAVSYWFSKEPSVGASGAIFGLVGSFAMFVLRHRGMVKGIEGHLQYIAQVILLNMVVGLIGGVAVSLLLGPAWKVESVSCNGRPFFIDKAPLFSLIKRYTKCWDYGEQFVHSTR